MSAANEPHDHRDHDIGCLQAIEVFYAYLDGEIDEPAAIADFERHLAHCRSCYSRAELEGLLTERLRSIAAERAPEALRRRLRLLLDEF